MSEYFSEPKSLGRRVKVELDLSNYALKKDFKNEKNIPTNLTIEESKVDKLDVAKLVPLPVDLSKAFQ